MTILLLLLLRYFTHHNAQMRCYSSATFVKKTGSYSQKILL